VGTGLSFALIFHPDLLVSGHGRHTKRGRSAASHFSLNPHGLHQTQIERSPTRCSRQQDGQRIPTSTINNHQSTINSRLGLDKIERSAVRCGGQQDGQRIPVGRRSIFPNANSTGLATSLGIHADDTMVRLPHPTLLLESTPMDRMVRLPHPTFLPFLQSPLRNASHG